MPYANQGTIAREWRAGGAEQMKLSHTLRNYRDVLGDSQGRVPPFEGCTTHTRQHCTTNGLLFAEKKAPTTVAGCGRDDSEQRRNAVRRQELSWIDVELK